MKTSVHVTDPRTQSGYRAAVVRARRPFLCSFCGSLVKKGEQYARTRDYHSSRDYDFKVCGKHLTN